ncbi:bifunctional glutamine synthetase adenylyltransferase/deadenyltransferase [Amylibacter sp.]|nr:bifunctional glutamine synthetase adenylyltransferase/deadenyltransferase [Amylibacter sp.]
MIFKEPILHFPIPFDPSVGENMKSIYGDLPSKTQKLIRGIAGSSSYLKKLLEQHSEWLLTHWEFSPDEAILAARKLDGNLDIALRVAKARTALVLALIDLSHLRPLEWITENLTNFADFAVQSALKSELELCVSNSKIKKKFLDENNSAGIFVLAMGKMGAYELNYSSDIDLIFLFDGSQFPKEEISDYRSIFIKITQKVFSLISKNTAHGYVFRTDLRLRPNPSVTSVCPTMQSAEAYYIREGRTWERAAFIKARVCAGNKTIGNNFLQRMQKFIWRQELDFAAIGEIEQLLIQSRQHKEISGPITVEGHNLKLGQGGIREIEFFAQAHQLIYGGRHQDLRQISTQGALQALTDQNRITPKIAKILITALRQHRKIEHRIQMLRDTQSHSIPTNLEELERLCALSGYAKLEDFKNDIIAELRKTHSATKTSSRIIKKNTSPTDQQKIHFDEWRKLQAFKSERAVEVFETQLQYIWNYAQNSKNPNEVLDYFGYFLSGLTSGVQLFSLFERRPDILEKVIYVTSLSKQLADDLAKQVSVLDGLADTGPDAIPSNLTRFQKSLQARLINTKDFETSLTNTRAWKSEEHFKIIFAQLTQIITPQRAEKAYSDLAQTCLNLCLDQALCETKRRFGEIPGSSVAILAMGKMGSQEMSCTSDLDIIVIYDGNPDSVSSFKELDIRTYFQKVTRTLISGLSSSMSYGRLYEVDMRLRPSGRAGTVATSLEGFVNYQKTKAWLWEKLALTRARVVAGDKKLCSEINKALIDILGQKNDPREISIEVNEMRLRISKLEIDINQKWQIKKLLGGILDLELLSQSLTLLIKGKDHKPSDQLKNAFDKKIITKNDYDVLFDSLELFSVIEHLKRLLGMKEFKSDNLSTPAVELFINNTGIESINHIGQEIEKSLNKNSGLIQKLISELK